MGMSVDAHHNEKGALGVRYTSSVSLALQANGLQHAIWRAHDEPRAVTFIPRPETKATILPDDPSSLGSSRQARAERSIWSPWPTQMAS